MNHDLEYAAISICSEIDRLESALEGMALHRDLSDLEALEIALLDLESAKKSVLLALCGKEVQH